MADKKRDYEVLHRVRLEDGTLVRPSSEENPSRAADEVKTISLTEEKAQPFLNTGAIRSVPTRRQVSAEDETTQTHVAPVSPAPGAPPVETSPASLAETFGEDLAATLEAGGYTSVAAVQAASDEDLLKIDGFGQKSLEKVRASQGA